MRTIEKIKRELVVLNLELKMAERIEKEKYLKSLDPLLKELEKVEIPKSFNGFDPYLLKALIRQIKDEH